MNAAPPGAADVVWRLLPIRRLHWREWGGDSVVYDELSGQTHQFSPLAAAIIAWLEERPYSTAQLTSAIAGELRLPPDADLQQAIADALEQFRELAWIEPLKPA